MLNSPPLHWIIEERSHGIFLGLNQEWDSECLTEITEILDQISKSSSVKYHILNLSSLSFIDSMALGILISLHNKYKDSGKSLYILNPNSTVEKILKQSGLYKVFPIYYNESELEKHLSSLPNSSHQLN